MSLSTIAPYLMLLGALLFYVAGVFFRRPDAPRGLTLRPRGIWKDLTPAGSALAIAGLSLLCGLGFVWVVWLR